jgi:hypothetical protein
MRGVTWRAVPAKVKTGICEMKILGSDVLWRIFVTLVQDGLAQMRGVTWRSVPAKVKRGMCEMKILRSEVLWCILGRLFHDGLAKMRGVTWRAAPAKFKRGMWGVVTSLFYDVLCQIGICDANKSLIRCGGGNWVGRCWKKRL